MFRVRKAQLFIEYVNGKTRDVCPRSPIPTMGQVRERVQGTPEYVAPDQWLYFFFASRKRGESARVKRMTSSPVAVLMS